MSKSISEPQAQHRIIHYNHIISYRIFINVYNQQYESNAEKLKELQNEANAEVEPTMLRVMDNYKKSVDFFNNYGLKCSAQGSRKGKSGSENVIDGKGTFWDLN